MPQTMKMTILAQDPSVKFPDGTILRAQVEVPYESLEPGPRGSRVHVVDYDSSQRVLYHPAPPPTGADPFARASDKQLLRDPAFRAQNVYAIVMRLLARFEAALGRRVAWSFGGHQLHVAPHAFADANAYYSYDARGLFFGYFPAASGETVYCCLSHDIVAHEATHAILDGFRESYMLPSHPDQGGFHEGFADIVALLSVFALPDVVRALLPKTKGREGWVPKKALDAESLRKTALLGLAEQFGQEASGHRADCLRRAVARTPDREALQDREFEECHLRGEILSAAVLSAFVEIWAARLQSWLPELDKDVPCSRVVEDGADAAGHLLSMCIRALDYCPAVDLTFPDFLSALLTADRELIPDGGKYRYRSVLRKEWALWGITPASGTPDEVRAGLVAEQGLWKGIDPSAPLSYDSIHRESLEASRDEVFRFLWQNRRPLELFENAYTWVISVRPCMRVAPDGFILRETVSEYRQRVDLEAGQLAGTCRGLVKPKGMPDATQVCLNGGGVLVFDEFGHLKYHIHSRIDDPKRQNARLDYLWRKRIHDTDGRYGFSDGVPRGQRFALMHRRRDGLPDRTEEWV
jgi:hypothetical protein